MTKKELQEIADTYGLYTKQDVKNRVSCELLRIGARNEELLEENAELKAYNEKLFNGDIEKHSKIVELEEKISILLSCKNCPDNKGGYICQKEYEDKCLAQKIQYIKELQKENTELKNQIEKMKCCANCKYQCQFLYQIADCLKNGLFKWEILEASLND